MSATNDPNRALLSNTEITEEIDDSNLKLVKCPRFITKFNSGLFGKVNLSKYFEYKGSVPITGTEVAGPNKVLACKICKEVKRGDGASNFVRHIQIKHKDVALLPQSTSSESNGDLVECHALPCKQVQKVPLTSAQQLCFKQAMVDLVAIDRLPLHFIEGKAFRAFMAMFLPQINLQCRRTVTRDLKKRVSQEISTKLKGLLNGVSFLHLMLDIWSTRTREAVLGIKCQFLTEDFEFQNRTLAFTHFAAAHTGENILSKVEQILHDLGVSSTQIVTVCADNASNMVKAFNLQALYAEPWNVDTSTDESDSSDELDDAWNDQSWIMVENIMSRAKWTRLGCVAHTLQLVVVDSLKNDPSSKTVIETVNEIIMFFRKSTKWTEELRSQTNGLDLVCPVKTRWNSLCFAMDRFLLPGMKTAIIKVLTDALNAKESSLASRGITAPPGPLMFNKIKDIQGLLSPIRDVTNCLQGDGPLISIVVMKLLETFETIYENNTTKFGCLRNLLLANMESRFSVHLSDPFFIIPAMVDPRQKFFIFEDDFSSPPWAETHPDFKTPTKDVARQILENYAAEFWTPTNQDHATAEPTSKCFSLMHKKRPRLESGSLKDIIHAYEKEDTANTEFSCPLAYWKTYQRKYPAIAGLAKRHLSAPATSASCERMFSKGGSLKRPRRSRLSIELIEACLIYQEYREPQLDTILSKKAK